MPELTIRALDRDEIDLAWPIVRTGAGIPSQREWKQLARHVTSRGGGVLVVCAEDGLLHGLATYEPKTSERLGKFLDVEAFVTFELSRKQPVRNALRGALSDLAWLTGCRQVRLPDKANSGLWIGAQLA